MKMKKFFRQAMATVLSASMLMSAAAVMPQVMDSGVEVQAADVENDFYTSENNDGTITITGFKTTAKQVVIPSTLYGEKVTAVSISGSAGNSTIEKVTIPDTVKSVSGFHNFTALKTISIPDSVESLDYGVFENCTSLVSVKLPKKQCECYYMFSGCSSLKSVVIPDGWTEVHGYMFFNCVSLESVTLPSSITEIGFDAFHGCKKLNSVNLPSSLTEIGKSAFEECESLRKVVIPSTVTFISGWSFFNCVSLEEISISGNPKVFYCAFGSCPNLKKMYVASTVTTDVVYYVSDDDECHNITSPDLVVYGVRNSAAHKSANNHNVPFVAIDEVTGISLNKTSCTLEKGKTVNLTASIQPSSAAEKTVTWSTSDERVATVSDGRVTARAAGTATITAKTANGKTATCKVTVTEPVISVTKVKMYKTKLTLGKGEKYTMAATVIPSGADKTLTWSTSDSSIVSVSDGVITAKNTGTAVITAKSKNGITARCNLTVKNAPASVSLPKKTLTLGLGEMYLFTAETPYNTASESNIYRSDNNSIIRGTKGEQFSQFKALKLGKANVSATTYNGKTASCAVTVKKAPTWVQLNKKTITLKTGQRATLTAKIAADTGCSEFKFSSDNSSVVRMLNTTGSGTFTAVRPGTANVTVTLYNGKQASCQVTVIS